MYLMGLAVVWRTPIPGVTPLDDVNRIRTRASLAPLLTVNLTQILEERILF
jgi:hypothetical protein